MVHSKQANALSSLWKFTMCNLSKPGVMKDFLQSRHGCGRSPVWIFLCTDRCADWRNVLWHEAHAKGLSPECVRLCISNFPPVVKDESHSVHVFDFLSLCTFICLASTSLDSKALLQILHACCSPNEECEFAWNFRWLVVRNAKEQIWHWWGFSPVCDLIWMSRFPSCKNSFPQVPHENGFSLVWIFWWSFRLLSHKRVFAQMWHSTAMTSNWREVQHFNRQLLPPLGNLQFKNISKVLCKRKRKFQFKDLHCFGLNTTDLGGPWLFLVHVYNFDLQVEHDADELDRWLTVSFAFLS